MALSTLLALICLACNFEEASRCIRKGIGLGDGLRGVAGDVKIYLLMVEGVAIVVVLVDAVRKYQKYRNEAFEAAQVQW